MLFDLEKSVLGIKKACHMVVQDIWQLIEEESHHVKVDHSPVSERTTYTQANKAVKLISRRDKRK